MIRARTYGFLLLALVAIAPLVMYGLVSIQRSEHTAIGEVREGNERVAVSIAHRIEAYLEHEQVQVESVGAAVLQARDAGDAQALLDAFSLRFRHYEDLEVFDADGRPYAGRTSHGRELAARALAAEAVQRGPVEAARRADAAGFAHTMRVAVPVFVAGRLEGAVAAQVDLVGIWPPVNSIKVGQTGFIRLLSDTGELLAHGDPEERRSVFDADPTVDAQLVSAAMLRRTAVDHQGDEVIASLAAVPSTGWIVLVEQDVTEAFASAVAMRRDLVVFGLATLVLVALAGILFGRILVRGLERLRAHTRVLARGDLQARIPPHTRIVEINALGTAMNEMAGELDALQKEARARERLTTFGRVAAGLAHDLRLPLSVVQAACEDLRKDPSDQRAWRYFEKTTDQHLPRLLRYVMDLLRLARSGELSLELSEAAPRDLAQEVVDELRANPKSAGVELRVEGDAGDFVVDRDLVRRAVLNLASNAVDACSGRGPGGRVAVRVGEAAGQVTFDVVDNGPGISPARLDDLRSGDFKTSKRTSGIGLGLGVVRQVADAHGGMLRVSSEVGVGSTFGLVIPRRGGSVDRAHTPRVGVGGEVVTERMEHHEVHEPAGRTPGAHRARAHDAR